MIPNRQAAVAWWRDLQPDPARGRPGDRAALARLRRCATVAEAMQDPAAISLFRRCGATGPQDLPAIGLAAAVLAHLREDRPEQRVARQIGPESPEKPETALLKPLRFRRLMEAASPDERLTAFRRLIALAGGALNAADLAEALLDWSESRQRRWVYDYWNAAPRTDRAGTAIAAEDTAA
ncbi:MAG: type I-E CRISPR-associated protein Cse2/CasB [Acetobacteraceae bacterium]|nr:type I-E CRISPR-associated protein Cse2/CasB [Acetobacteraceae bacterium]